jgi:hypothetical protein
MGEFVGVDPAYLKELANRLERLHTLLADHGPAIQQKMRKWDSDISFAALPRLIDEALGDARDMTARTTTAYELAREKGWSPLQNGPGTDPSPHGQTHPPTVRLDWTTTGQSGHEAKQDAKALAGALAAKDPEQARARMSLLPDSLARHLGDKPYLVAFWSEACPLALQAARALYSRAGATLFSAESASILRALGSSLAAATQMRVGTGEDRRPLLSDATRAAITESSDPWSVGMLFKYGPDGKTWDSHFLADVTRAMLDARAAGKIDVPVSVAADETSDVHDVGSRYFSTLKLQADFDPVYAVLDRAAQNGQAGRHVLGDEATGYKYAKILINDDWHAQGGDTEAFAGPARDAVPERLDDHTDLSAPHRSEFLKAAVSAGRGASEDAKESAWSLVDIVKATSEFARLHPGSVLPREVRQAFIFAADRYLPDLAASADQPGDDGVKTRDGDAPGPYVARVAGADLESFLRQAVHDPEDFGRFQGALDARLSAGVTATIKDGGQNYLAEMASLYGVLSGVRASLGFTEGMEKEARAQRARTARSLVLGGFGALGFSTTTGAGTGAQVFLATARPLLSKEPGNAAAIESGDPRLHVKASVVQGLINAGAVRLAPQTSWLRNGVVTPDAGFGEWYGAHEGQRFGDQTLTQWVRAAEHAMDT